MKNNTCAVHIHEFIHMNEPGCSALAPCITKEYAHIILLLYFSLSSILISILFSHTISLVSLSLILLSIFSSHTHSMSLLLSYLYSLLILTLCLSYSLIYLLSILFSLSLNLFSLL
jgi:hypothetical protein